MLYSTAFYENLCQIKSEFSNKKVTFNEVLLHQIQNVQLLNDSIHFRFVSLNQIITIIISCLRFTNQIISVV